MFYTYYYRSIALWTYFISLWSWIFSMSPQSKIRKYLINAIISNNTPFLPYRLHLDEQQTLTLILNIPTTTLYCWISIIPVPVTTPRCRIADRTIMS